MNQRLKNLFFKNFFVQKSAGWPKTVWFYPVLSGILVGTSYIPFPPWAVFFCYTPLWFFALQQKSLKPLLIGGWLCQFVFNVIGFHWAAYTIKEFGFFPWPLAVLGFLAFAGFANLHIPIALWVWFYLKPAKNTLTAWVLLPVLFALGQKYYPMIFPWYFSYTWFYAGWPAVQTAELWGFSFIHTLILFSNLLFVFVFKHFKKGKKPLWALGGWLLAFALLNGWGLYLQNRLPPADKTARVLVIQPSISHQLQREPYSGPMIMNKLIDQTSKALKNQEVDFILWPEGAYPYAIHTHAAQGAGLRGDLKKAVQKWNTPLVLSAIGLEPKGYSNAMFVFDQKGDLSPPPYRKIKLLAFGEYMPGEKWLGTNKLFSYYGRSFLKGNGEGQTTRLSGLNLGFQICYEGLFDEMTKNMVQTPGREPDILVNVTNDSWFGWWWQPWQHLYMTMARAIEVRKPIVRGTNSGFSAMVSARGSLSSPFIQGPWSGIWQVPYSRGRPHTQFVKWGYYINSWFLWSVLAWLLAARFALYWKKPLNKPLKKRD